MGDTVKVTSDQASYTHGEEVKLTATVDPPQDGVTWTWQRKGADPSAVWETLTEQANELSDAPEPGTWTYRATANHGGNDVGFKDIEIEVKDAGRTPPDGSQQTEEPVPLTFDMVFAVVVGLVVLGLLIAFVVGGSLFGLNATVGADAAKLDPRGALAAKVMGPMLALGALLLLAGLWMVIVEWRGTFATATASGAKERGAPSIPEIIKAMGALKGANLVFVGGLVIVLAVAWMVSSTAGAETDPAPTPSSSETGTAPATEPTAPATEPTTPAPEPTSTL